jgi:hypothetical protein
MYCAAALPGDRDYRPMPASECTVTTQAGAFPIYGALSTFSVTADRCVGIVARRPIDYRRSTDTQLVWRIGYDLFAEVRYLLTEGQPASNAATPTLELHVELLRQILCESGVPFVEIPARPHAFDFTCCLTHDVDFFGLARHRFDRTLAGFLSRASIGSLWDLARGRRTVAEASRNLRTCAALPLIFAGLVRDPWSPFDDYAAVEDGARSTFFLVPFGGQPGVAPDGTVDTLRAVPYGIGEIRTEACVAEERGCELAVHGLDAWRDAGAGRAELAELTAITKRATAGVRMHWLYFDRDSGQRLEDAGFDYDSTWGYNEAVGYRAGTSQPFRLTGTSRLLELPLSIMDSALFSGKRLGLDAARAAQLCDPIVANAKQFGGTLVVNWHERSLAPERLWGRFYRELLEKIERGNRVWFAKAGEAVEWFRWRRSIRFVSDATQVAVRADGANPHSACIRVHRQTPRGWGIEDTAFGGAATVQLDNLTTARVETHQLTL